MNGWLAMAVLAALSAGLILTFMKARAQLRQAVIATVVLAMAGYAWQGSPALPEAPAKPIAAEQGAAEALLTMRGDMDQNFGQATSWLRLADGFARDGDYAAAAGIIQGGLKQYPKNPDLWSALGLVLMLAADGDLTPPAKLAFKKARDLAPLRPQPDYFEGLAALFDGKPAVTVELWGKLLERATPKAGWRPRLESQYAGLQQMLSQPAPPAVQ
jgi:cytochrome c-type biogenesis protein CcmH